MASRAGGGSQSTTTAATSTTSHEIQTKTQTQPQNPNSNLSSASTTANTTPPPSINGKKRPLNYAELLQSSPYFKMRAVVKDLRSLVLEVLRAPDIQNCEAAHGVQEKLKLMLDLCKQKTVENAPMVKCNSGNTGNSDLPPQPDRSFAKPPEERRFSAGSNLEKTESNRIPGTYIVGGSAFGWNFITFHGTKPEYYGRTKEAFRAGK